MCVKAIFPAHFSEKPTNVQLANRRWICLMKPFASALRAGDGYCQECHDKAAKEAIDAQEITQGD